MAAWQVMANTPRLYRGTITRHPKVSRIPCRTLTIEGSGPCPLEMDGEAVGYLPASFSILPRAVRLRG
jgi:diacylglycerol kinase family enzyme